MSTGTATGSAIRPNARAAAMRTSDDLSLSSFINGATAGPFLLPLSNQPSMNAARARSSAFSDASARMSRGSAAGPIAFKARAAMWLTPSSVSFRKTSTSAGIASAALGPSSHKASAATSRTLLSLSFKSLISFFTWLAGGGWPWSPCALEASAHGSANNPHQHTQFRPSHLHATMPDIIAFLRRETPQMRRGDKTPRLCHPVTLSPRRPVIRKLRLINLHRRGQHLADALVTLFEVGAGGLVEHRL